jgi:hypothetical protein
MQGGPVLRMVVLACGGLFVACFPSTEGLTGGPADGGAQGRDSAADASDAAMESSPVDAARKDVTEPGDARPEADAPPCSPDLGTDPHNCGFCGHDCLDAGCGDGACGIVTVAANENDPTAMVIDSANVYWTDFGTMASGYANETIRRCPKTGCDTATTLAPASGFPYGIAVSGASLYWTETNTGAVASCTLPACSTVTTLATGQTEVYDVVTDPSGSTLLWTNGGLSGSGDGSVMSCALPACSAPAAVATGLDFPYGLSANATDAFFADQGTSALDGKIFSCPLAGCGASPTLIQGGQLLPSYVAIDKTRVYWTATGGGSVSLCPLAGCAGDPQALGTGQMDPYAIGVDALNVYWTNYTSSGQVMTCPIAGCPAGGPLVLAADQPYPSTIAIDAEWVYWVNSGAADGTGAVLKIAK